MSLREQILGEVERFLSATEMAPTSFGRKAVGDPMLLDRLENTNIGIDTVERIRKFMRDNAPEGRDTAA